MLGRGRRRHVFLLGALLLLVSPLHAPEAYSAPGDPPRGSPAGSVYQLPLQQGRQDAAPKGGGGDSSTAGGGSDSGGSGSGSSGSGGSGGGASGSGGEGAAQSDSLYRTENDFGSSSRVPGAAIAGTAAAGAAAGQGGSGSAGDGDRGGGGQAGGTIAGDVVDSGNTSVPAALALLGAIGLLAAAVALLSRRFSRS